MAKKPITKRKISAKSTKSKAKKPPYYITQSLMKSVLDLRENKECGLVFKAKFLENKWDLFHASDAQSVGTWFEYELTGAMPKNGKIPQPKRTQKGELTSDYKKIQPHIEHFKRTQAYYQFEIVEIGTDWIIDDLKGTIDLLCLAKIDIVIDGVKIVKAGQKFILDLKTTGLLDDKWNDYGWELNNLGNKVKLITQPIHYKYIAKKKYGEDMPFLFFLFSTSNPHDFRIINFEVDEQAYLEHITFINTTKAWMAYYLKNGFEPKPSPAKCEKCPLKVGCKFFAAVPKIETFHYGGTI